ncbi:hypothetical protein Scep_001688 [Stephania cephalantha]|uniref:Uncharacterized protein n=1 Tax=Stephania cephalantha TaxID=152367 RepID=A0AAP0L8G5_9MAGN
MLGIHLVFHIYMLRLVELKAGLRMMVDLSNFDLSDDISYEEQPIQILDQSVQPLRNMCIPKVLVKWQSTMTQNSFGSGETICMINSRTYSSQDRRLTPWDPHRDMHTDRGTWSRHRDLSKNTPQDAFKHGTK